MAFELDVTTARLFIAIAVEGSIAAAARRENIAASAISKRISGMEQHFGVKLLQRQASGAGLTYAGTVMLRRARNLLNESRSLESELRHLGHEIIGHVRIAGSESALFGFLPERLAACLEKYPGITVELDEQLSADIVRSVEQQSVDIGLISSAVSVDGMWVRPCFWDRIVALARKDHPLAAFTAITLEQLIEHEIIGLDPRGGLLMVERQAALIGKQLRIRVRTDGYDVVCRLAAAGVGVGIVAESVASIFGPALNLVSLPFLEPWARREHRVCVKPPQGALAPAARMVLNSLFEE